MPVKSYLVFPKDGQKEMLAEELNHFSWCEVMPAENKDVMVMVTDTADEKEEENCLDQLNDVASIKHYTLVSGFEEKLK